MKQKPQNIQINYQRIYIQFYISICGKMQKSNTPLSKTCKFWFQKFQKTEEKTDFKQTLFPIATISTLQQFWAYYQHLKRPSNMEENSYIYLFKEGVTPIWEDPANQGGGSFTILIQKLKSDRLWEDLLLSFISVNTEQSKLINGIRLKIRKDIASIDIWISNLHGDKVKHENLKKWCLSAASLREDSHIEFINFTSQ